MEGSQTSVLVVDDEPLNLLLIEEYLRDSAYRLQTVTDGVDAWDLLYKNPRDYDVVLLDLMMPRMDGLEVLKRIKAHPQLQLLPVILQTALASREDMHDGIRAGAYYYLTKPFEKEMLRSVVATAAEDCMRYRRLQDEIERTSRMFGLMSNALFRFKTLAQARELASLLANACPNPRKAVIGISELLVNAVEHGNLGIGYDEKGMLLQSGQLDQEVQRRLELPEYRDLDVDVCYERTEKEIRISITDQGEGFDWRSFSNMAPERVFDAHGRGIAVARIMSFDQLEFFGEGNQVKGVIRLLE